MLSIPEESPFASDLNQFPTMYTYTTQSEIRAAFWEAHPWQEKAARVNRTLSKGQNAQTCTTRSYWCEFIDQLARYGKISEALADRVTL